MPKTNHGNPVPGPASAAPAPPREPGDPLCRCGKVLGDHYTDGRRYYCKNPMAWEPYVMPDTFAAPAREATPAPPDVADDQRHWRDDYLAMSERCAVAECALASLEARLRDAEKREIALRLAGIPLATAAYNLAQSSKLDDGVRASLRTGYERWDETTRAHALAVRAALRAVAPHEDTARPTDV